MKNDILEWLQRWYLQNCNGDWEHGYGVFIETLDNPGWLIKINLEDTQYENIEVDKYKRQNKNNEDDWAHYKIENKIFQGACGPLNLIEILQYFKDIIDKQKPN
ncbi:MAG: immunity 53 family protein [Nanoarchaeota archaeon]